jgi:pre-peptidase
MVSAFTQSQPRRAARRWQRMSGLVAVLALGVALAGLVPSTAHAQKSIDFFTTGSVRSTLVFTNQIVPDTYYFFATAGEYIRVQTSYNAFDTTLRVVGPDVSINLFDDDSGGGTASRLTFYAADTGAYIVVVSSFSGNPGGGDYTLTFARGAYAASSGASPADEAQAPGESLAPGVNEPQAK